MRYREQHEVVDELGALERADVVDVVVVCNQLAQVLVRHVVAYCLQARDLRSKDIFRSIALTVFTVQN